MISARNLLTILLTVGLSSCSFAITCDLYNGTAGTIDVSVMYFNEKTEKTLKPGEHGQFVGFEAVAITIRTTGNAWCYKPSYVPGAFVADVGWGPWTSRVVKARLEQNGDIEVLRPEQLFTEAAPPQPKSFPLRPEGCKI